MKRHLLFFLKYYVAVLVLFVVAKGAFVLYNMGQNDLQPSDFFDIIVHGLPLDAATAGYLSVLPWLLTMIAIWRPFPALQKVYKYYCIFVAVLLALIFVADTCLYEFWGFKLDGTVFAYLDSPKGALASVTGKYIAVVVLVFLVAVLAFFILLFWLWDRRFAPASRRIRAQFTFLLIGGILFLAIRGGVGKSTANVGMVYYSDKAFCNHAAVNPLFSIIASSFKTKDFSRLHDYFSEGERAEWVARLHYSTRSLSPDTLLRTKRPNVLLILMEGCGAAFVEAFGGEPGVTPSLNQLAAQGVRFTQCYANSFRTDRGTVCTLSGYPSFPDVSVMKLASRAARLPSIARSLSAVGYHTEFVYGGDINFTNMNGYLISTGYKRTYGDKDFPAEQRKSHDWGVTDCYMFEHLADIIDSYPTDRPWHTTFLTLASHEPWKVPYNRIPNDERANAMAYLDDCIGKFMEGFRKSEHWDNTLVIFVPDHGIHYPLSLHPYDMKRNHIPLIWSGGAIRGPREINRICNQTDLPATLLGQLGLSHDDFLFSRDVVSQNYTYPCAIHTASGVLSFIDTTGVSVVDLISQPEKTLLEEPAPSPRRRNAAHALLQTFYDDLGS